MSLLHICAEQPRSLKPSHASSGDESCNPTCMSVYDEMLFLAYEEEAL